MTQASAANTATGRCLCGDITFRVAEMDADHGDACHCAQCRRWAGHAWASVNAPVAALAIDDPKGLLTWYRSSELASRGFCSACGSSLFWRRDLDEQNKHRIAIAVGALDAPTGVRLAKHIYVADKGDYYEIEDGLSKYDGDD